MTDRDNPKKEDLSEEEIGMLLNALGTGVRDSSAHSEPENRDEALSIFLSKRPPKLTRENSRVLCNIFEHVSRRIRNYLTAFLGESISVYVAYVDEIAYETVMQSLPNPSMLEVFSLNPLPGYGVLNIGPKIAFSMINLAFGGDGQIEIEKKDVTAIEASVIEKIMDSMISLLKEPFQPYLRLHPQSHNFEVNGQFLKQTEPEEVAILVSLETKIAEHEGEINFVVPFMTLEPILHLLIQAPESISRYNNILGNSRELICDIDIPFSILMKGTEMSIEELGRLKKGSMLLLQENSENKFVVRFGTEEMVELKMKNRWSRVSESSFEISGFIEETRIVPYAIKQADDNLNAMSDSVLKQDVREERLENPEHAENHYLKSEIKQNRFDFLLERSIRVVPTILLMEDLQTVALIVSRMGEVNAIRLLSEMDLNKQSIILAKISSIRDTAEEILEVVEMVLRNIMMIQIAPSISEKYGFKKVVSLLSSMDPGNRGMLTEAIEKIDSKLFAEIQKCNLN